MHWSYACEEDPSDIEDEISGDSMRDERPIEDELDSMMHQLDMAIEPEIKIINTSKIIKTKVHGLMST